MKKAFRIFWGLFILGFVIKFFHIPGGEALFVLSIMTLTILAIIEFVKGIIQKAPLVVYGKLFDLNLILWLGYFVARLRFCPWLLGFLQFCLCIMISAYLMFKLKSNDRFLFIKKIILVLLIICGLFMVQVHNYSICRLINMNSLIKSNENAHVYDRYSYFLFVGGKTEEAVAAGEKAIKLSIIENGENSEKTNQIKRNLEQRKNNDLTH